MWVGGKRKDRRRSENGREGKGERKNERVGMGGVEWSAIF